MFEKKGGYEGEQGEKDVRGKRAFTV